MQNLMLNYSQHLKPQRSIIVSRQRSAMAKCESSDRNFSSHPKQSLSQQVHLHLPALLQSAIPEAYINGIGYFTNVWEQFTGTNPTEITAGQQQLLALAQGQQPRPTDEAAQKSLQRMLRYHIIEKINNQYQFEVPLIERWVREKSS